MLGRRRHHSESAQSRTRVGRDLAGPAGRRPQTRCRSRSPRPVRRTADRDSRTRPARRSHRPGHRHGHHAQPQRLPVRIGPGRVHRDVRRGRHVANAAAAFAPVGLAGRQPGHARGTHSRELAGDRRERPVRPGVAGTVSPRVGVGGRQLRGGVPRPANGRGPGRGGQGPAFDHRPGLRRRALVRAGDPKHRPHRSPERSPHLSSRPGPKRPSVLRHGTSERRGSAGPARSGGPLAREPGGRCHSAAAGRAQRRPRGRAHSRRRQAGQRVHCSATRRARARGPARFWPGPSAAARHHGRIGRRHAPVHGARAAPRVAGRRPVRRVLRRPRAAGHADGSSPHLGERGGSAPRRRARKTPPGARGRTRGRPGSTLRKRRRVRGRAHRHGAVRSGRRRTARRFAGCRRCRRPMPADCPVATGR